MKRGPDDSWEEVENKVQKLDGELVLYAHLPQICWMADNWFQAHYLLGTVCKSWYYLMKGTAFPANDMNTPFIDKLVDLGKKEIAWNFQLHHDMPITAYIQIVIALRKLEYLGIRPRMSRSLELFEFKTHAIFERLNLNVYDPIFIPVEFSPPMYNFIFSEFRSDMFLFALEDLPHFKLPELHFKLLQSNMCGICTPGFNLRTNLTYIRFRKAKKQKNIKAFNLPNLNRTLPKLISVFDSFPELTKIDPRQLDNTTDTLIGMNSYFCSDCQHCGISLLNVSTPMMTKPRISIELYDLHAEMIWLIFCFVHRFSTTDILDKKVSESGLIQKMITYCERYEVEKKFTYTTHEINFIT